jgi:hypothetical protein
MEMLENRVQELNQKNEKVQLDNEALRARVAQLEAELQLAKTGMAVSLSAASADGMSAVPPSSLFGARMAGLSAEATQVMISEKFNLQRRAALAGLGGNMGVMGAGQGSDPTAALRYMQLMKAQSAMEEKSGMHMPLSATSAYLAAGRNSGLMY